MGKRSNFQRRKNDDYPTPFEAVLPLWPEIRMINGTEFYEPCAGKGDLIKHLEALGAECHGFSDIEKDATNTQYETEAQYFITNPPWTRELLHPIILNLCKQKITWLLFDADWMHTKQAVPYLHHCFKILSVGRVKWIPDSPFVGKDNACWYGFIFNESKYGLPTQFKGR